jgi:hypothetical protein
MTDRPVRYAIIKIATDSTGREVTYPDTVCVGSYNAVMERVFDTKQRREALTLKNDAEHARGTLQAMREEKRAIAARADAVAQAEDLIRQLCDAVNTLTARIDSFEEEQRAQAEAEERARNEEPITLPPGADPDPDNRPIADEGELQAAKEPRPQYQDPDPEPVEPEPPEPPELIEDDDGDGDPGAVLPQAPIPPSDRRYDPNPDPNTTLNLSTVVEDQ